MQTGKPLTAFALFVQQQWATKGRQFLNQYGNAKEVMKHLGKEWRKSHPWPNWMAPQKRYPRLSQTKWFQQIAALTGIPPSQLKNCKSLAWNHCQEATFCTLRDDGSCRRIPAGIVEAVLRGVGYHPGNPPVSQYMQPGYEYPAPSVPDLEDEEEQKNTKQNLHQQLKGLDFTLDTFPIPEVTDEKEANELNLTPEEWNKYNEFLNMPRNCDADLARIRKWRQNGQIQRFDLFRALLNIVFFNCQFTDHTINEYNALNQECEQMGLE